MRFSPKAAMRALVAPNHRISCNRRRWRAILRELDRRGERRHEAGAFLLGHEVNARRDVVCAVYYDELDPHAYDTGVCILHAEAFGRLWTLCRERGLSVVADVHTHGGEAGQSESDRTNPMVAQAGHVAIIVPDCAAGRIPLGRLSVHQYLGDHRWSDVSPSHRSPFLYVGLWS